jgi:RecA/RadA recombinase
VVWRLALLLKYSGSLELEKLRSATLFASLARFQFIILPSLFRILKGANDKYFN